MFEHWHVPEQNTFPPIFYICASFKAIWSIKWHEESFALICHMNSCNSSECDTAVDNSKILYQTEKYKLDPLIWIWISNCRTCLVFSGCTSLAKFCLPLCAVVIVLQFVGCMQAVAVCSVLNWVLQYNIACSCVPYSMLLCAPFWIGCD